MTKSKGQGADKTTSRAREVEEKRGVKGRLMSRGRNILTDSRETLEDSGTIESDEEGLGGCKSPSGHIVDSLLTLHTDGFFDAGMLLSALKASKEEDLSDKAAQRRNIGRMLRIAEY
jgi:hypothetical protein